jgi:ABC-2 type transport system permease protein
VETQTSDKNNSLTYAFVILGSVFFILSIYVGSVLFRGVKVDLTEENIYTISDTTKDFLGKLGRPISIKLFYSEEAVRKGSEDFRFFNIYYSYVRNFLREYIRYSNKMIQVEFIDPKVDSEAEDLAMTYGLRGIGTGVSSSQVFFGMVTSGPTGSTHVIPFFSPKWQSPLISRHFSYPLT